MEQNPYAPPLDDTPPVAAPTGDDGFIEGGRGVEVGRGPAWLTEGWGLVKDNLGSWIVICILYVVIAVVISIIPVAGQLVFPAIAPLLSAGLYLGCQDTRLGGHQGGREFGVGHLFEGFKHAGGLLGIGLVHLVQTLMLAGVGLATGVGGAFNTRSPFAAPAGNPLDPSRLQGLGIYLAAVLVLAIPFGMATYYAPALVAIRGMPPLAAIKNSFLGASKNILPFIVYSFAAGLLSIGALLPCGLGFLVLIPVMIASVYVGYRDVFFADPSS